MVMPPKTGKFLEVPFAYSAKWFVFMSCASMTCMWIHKTLCNEPPSTLSEDFKAEAAKIGNVMVRHKGAGL